MSAAPPAADEKARYVKRMFGAIAPRYDLLNHLLSAGVDRRWRKAAVERLDWEGAPGGIYLDACAGTLDLSLELEWRSGFEGTVVGSDFSLPMLARGQGKLEGSGVQPLCADTLRLPFSDETFDGALVGFGVRNLAALDAGLKELARVLKPGARLVILEFTTPPRQPLRSLYLLYFRYLLPLIGKLVSRHGEAYSYLPASVLEFPEPEELAERMTHAGFRSPRWELRTGGIAALHWGERE
ncbi:MAG: ubiquinone/menaquinone biosynthesis methyltransferase [Longimicrobiaceae bacterium]